MDSNSIIISTRDLVVRYIKDNAGVSKNEWCNKDNWWIVVNHTLRVEKYVTLIAKELNISSDEEVLTLELATIFHDIGKVVQNQEHAEVSARIVSELFCKTPFLYNSKVDFERLIKIISQHSNKKDENDNDILSLILKDSDILDEIGAMSILMKCSKHEFYTQDFYEKIIAAINEKELPFCEKKYLLLKTDTAKRIMEEKVEFIKKFNVQLEYEISGQINGRVYIE